jgi:hypothetical protein
VTNTIGRAKLRAKGRGCGDDREADNDNGDECFEECKAQSVMTDHGDTVITSPVQVLMANVVVCPLR